MGIMRSVMVVLSAFSSFGFFALPAAADVLLLKNGQRVEGNVLSETASEIKIGVSGVGVTFLKDEIEWVEKEVPAIIVKDEEQKQEVIKKLVDEKAVDRIYDITVEKTSPAQRQAQEAVRQQQERSAAMDAEGVPLPNVGVQFRSIEEIAAEEQAALERMTPDERRAYEERKAAAEKFYDER